MSIELQPPVTLVKTEPPTVIKKEPLEEALEEDIRDIDIVYHSLSEDLIKSETILEDILENKHLESVQTQALVVKAENYPFIKTENITKRNKSEDTSDGNISKGTGQGVVEVQASNEHSYASSNLQTDEQSVLNFSKNLNCISVRSRKSKSPKKTDIAECYKTDETSLWKKEKEKIKVIEAPVIPVEAHEYTSLAKCKHVCNHCQGEFNRLSNLKRHIEKLHREVTTMYQCPYCPYKSKWSYLRSDLTRHMQVHLRHKQMKDGLDLREKRHHCNKCDYKTYSSTNLKSHKLTHLKPEEIQYLYCYHCSYETKRKSDLKLHIFRHHFKNAKQGKRHHCNNCDYKTYINKDLKSHKLIHLKPEDIQCFYCYHCSYKSKRKTDLKNHIFRRHQFKNVKQGKRAHLKPEDIPHFHCYHCSYKSKRKGNLQRHIFKHFKNGEIKFDW